MTFIGSPSASLSVLDGRARDIFRRIVENAPAPIGLGPAMRRAA